MMIKKQKQASELMPKSEEDLHVLRARAEQLAQCGLDVSENTGIAFVHFRLSRDESYGIPYHHVHEVLHHTTVSKPPGVPDFIVGVINWRGALITVIDLFHFFHPQQSGQRIEFIIVVSANDITLGIGVSQVQGTENYHLQQLGSPLSSMDVVNPKYVLGLHQSVIAILNIEVLLLGLIQEIKGNVTKGENHETCYK